MRGRETQRHRVHRLDCLETASRYESSPTRSISCAPHPFFPLCLCASVFQNPSGDARKGNTEAQRSQIGLFIDCVSIRIFSHPFYFLLTPSLLPSVSLCLCVSKSVRGCAEGKHRGTEVTDWVVYRLRLDTNLFPPVLFPVHRIPSSLCVSVPLCFKFVRGYLNGALLQPSKPLHARDSQGKPCVRVDVDTSC